MIYVGLVTLPVAGLAVLLTAGLGLADLLGARLPQLARVALAAPLAAAVLASASPLVQAGIEPGVLGVVVLGGLGCLTLARAPRLVRSLRHGAIPLIVAVLAVAVSLLPAYANKSSAAEMYGNGDPYYWVSQAKAFETAPAPEPATVYPDRLTFDLISTQHWPVALPVGLADVALLDAGDPVDVYAAFGAILFALLALGMVAIARGILHWSPALALAAGIAEALNALELFANFYGWQAQIALTTFGTLAATTTALCFDRKTLRRESLLPALFGVAGVATYGWLFAPFALLAAVIGLVAAFRGCRGRGLPSVIAPLISVTALAAIIGFYPLFEAFRAYAITRGGPEHSILASWSKESWSLPADALGLQPYSPTLRGPGTGGVIFTELLSLFLGGFAISRVRSARNPRGMPLAAATAALLMGIAVFYLDGSSPYYSTKLMGYGSPLLVLFCLSAFVPGRERPKTARLVRAAVVVLAGALFVLASAVTASDAINGSTPATVYRSLERAANSLPRKPAVVVDDPSWRQVWLVYFLREFRVAIAHPTVYFSSSAGYDESHVSPIRFTTPARYAVVTGFSPKELWFAGNRSLVPSHHAARG